MLYCTKRGKILGTTGRRLTYILVYISMYMCMCMYTQTWTRTSRRSCLACFGGSAPAKAIGCTMIRCRLVSVFSSFLLSFLLSVIPNAHPFSSFRASSLLLLLLLSASEVIPWRFFCCGGRPFFPSVLIVYVNRYCDTDLN